MNIGRPRFHRVVNDGVDELDDRRHVRIRRKTVEVEDLFALVGFFYERDLERRCRFLQDALGRIAFPQNDVDRTRRRNVRHDPDVQRILKLVETFEICRVGHRRV